MGPGVLVRFGLALSSPAAPGCFGSRRERATKQDGNNPTAEEAKWLGPVEIRAIRGTLKPSAYVARAYKELLANQGVPPVWARKCDKGQWLFQEDYVMADARENLASISVAEAAGMLGATRRAVQNWVDNGDIAAAGGPGREKGERRRILREQFIRDLPRLRERLGTPAVVGFKLKHGQATDPRPAPGPGMIAAPEAARAPAPGDRIAEIEAQLRRARDERQKLDVPAAKAQVAEDAIARRRAAASTEAQFKAARAARQKAVEMEGAARKIAERLIGGVFGGEMGRIDATIIFNQYAEQHGIPDDIRNRIRKEYFGR